MQELNYQDVMKKKFERQESIKELEFHAAGHCIHIGKISPGCRPCFTNEGEGVNGVQIGNLCNCKCPMCYYDPNRQEHPQREINDWLANWFFALQEGGNYTPGISYQSTGETMMYLDQLEKFAALINKTEEYHGLTIYHHLYTNGILCTKENLKRLRDNLKIHEIRFHVTASLYGKNPQKTKKIVLDNMYEAAKMGFTISVEEPAYPKHKKELLNLLPILEDNNGKHLNLVEVQLTEFNFPNVNKINPNGKYFKDYFYHLYDEGLVYDIMEEVIAKNYHFSVLDCNSGVERCRQGRFQPVGFRMSSISGMCDEFDYYSPDFDRQEFEKNNLERWDIIRDKLEE